MIGIEDGTQMEGHEDRAGTTNDQNDLKNATALPS